ncbi:MAG: beta-propeller fold lactonase family protein [Solirubrobacteraceae bacterium]
MPEPHPKRWRRLTLVVALATLALGAVALAGTFAGGGRIGPSLRITANGRLLQPPGALVTLGHFPTGGAVTPDGHFLWTVSTGRALNDVRIVSVDGKRPRMIEVLALPGASGGIAIDPARPLVYVSGVSDSRNLDERRLGLPGRGGDVIHVFGYDRRRGRAREVGTIAVPPPAGAPVPENFPPKTAGRTSWPDRLAISADGRTLLVPLNLADAAAVIDTATRSVRYVRTGPFPYAAAILPGGRTGLVSNEGPGTVSVINLARATKVKDIQVAANISHPEGIAVDPKRHRAYVAVANEDQVAVLDTSTMSVRQVLSVQRPQGGGESPVAVSVTPDGRRLVVAEAAADELAVFALPSGTLLGRIPTAAYPADVQSTRRLLLWIAAKGFGSGSNPNGPNPFIANDDNLLQHPGTAVLSSGRAGILPFPTNVALARMTFVANRQLIPVNYERAPAGTPLRADGPIKHVFYIVRENRTYDQILGDDPRGDGDPELTLFGRRITPNFHALVQRFPLLDHVYADSEASIDGHFWTSAGAVSDYVQKNWEQNYAARGRPYDFGVYSITWPGTGFLFDRAQRQGISYYNFGEAIAGTVPLTALDRDNTPAQSALVSQKFMNSDVGAAALGYAAQCYPNDASIGTDAISGALGVKRETFDSSLPTGASPLSESRFSCFKQRFDSWISSNSVPSFVYMVLPSDHTNGLVPGARSPNSMVAENDYGLGQVVDLISHSKIWGSSAIFVLEDDSQDGADHVDAHRMPGAVFSPYAKPGALIHTRYDMLSFIRSMELILGMRPLSYGDSVATPMYDAFASTPVNSAPYSVLAPTYPLLERNPNNAVDRGLSRGYNFIARDQVPQDVFDRVLWSAAHGAGVHAPPPGPNAVTGR